MELLNISALSLSKLFWHERSDGFDNYPHLRYVDV